MASKSIFTHWPTILLGVLVAAILVVAIVTYQVNETESVVVTTLGRVEPESPAPGLHLRWPYPIQRIYSFDRRTRCFSGSVGKLEETQTADGQNILVGIFVNYRIDDPQQFFISLENIAKAESELNTWMRGAKLATIGRYEFNQIVNTDPAKMKLTQIQDEIRQELEQKAAPYGLTIELVGINSINVPTSISEKVFERMNDDRKRVVADFLARGEQQAKSIRIEADSNRAKTLADAEAKAKEIRAQGDAEAAKYYEVFSKNPELAIFLRKLDALSQIMKTRTTLVVDTNTAPFDLLQTNAESLGTK